MLCNNKQFVTFDTYLGETDTTFYTTEITSQFKEAFPVLYAEYDEEETSKKKRKPKKKTRGKLCMYFKNLKFKVCVGIGLAVLQINQRMG